MNSAKLGPSRSRFPAADDEYTPAQRRIIDASLARADADIKAGRVSRAFSDHGELIAALHEEADKLSDKKTKRQAKGTQFGGWDPPWTASRTDHYLPSGYHAASRLCS
jgi:hypothetical protein